MKANERVTATFESHTACIVSVEATTTGPQGGDAGHGGKATVLLCVDSGDMFVNGQPAGTVSLEFRGDAEVEGFVSCMEETARWLRQYYPG